MNKRIYIDLKNTEMGSFVDFGNSICKSTFGLKADEYPYIYLKHDITEDEFNKAIDTIITYFMQQKMYTMIVDLDDRNEHYMPTKEMTIDEIEKELGHKVKIVKKKK